MHSILILIANTGFLFSSFLKCCTVPLKNITFSKLKKFGKWYLIHSFLFVHLFKEKKKRKGNNVAVISSVHTVYPVFSCSNFFLVLLNCAVYSVRFKLLYFLLKWYYKTLIKYGNKNYSQKKKKKKNVDKQLFLREFNFTFLWLK